MGHALYKSLKSMHNLHLSIEFLTKTGLATLVWNLISLIKLRQPTFYLRPRYPIFVITHVHLYLGNEFDQRFNVQLMGNESWHVAWTLRE